MNKPLSPKQLDLMPRQGGEAEPINGNAAAILAASGLTPAEAATVEAIIAEAGPCDGFDWSNPDEDSIVVRPRPGVAIYRNKADEIVVRSQNVDTPDDGDHFAYLQEESLPAVITALKREGKR